MRCKTKEKYTTIDNWRGAPQSDGKLHHWQLIARIIATLRCRRIRIELLVNVSHEPKSSANHQKQFRINTGGEKSDENCGNNGAIAFTFDNETDRMLIYKEHSSFDKKSSHLRLGPKRGWSVKGNSFQLSLVVSNIKRFYCCGVDCFLNQQWNQSSDKGWSNSIVASLWEAQQKIGLPKDLKGAWRTFRDLTTL